MTTTLTATLQDLSDRYLALHTRKEDLFWEAKMGLGDDAAASRQKFAEAEIALNRFLQDGDTLRKLRALDAGGDGGEKERVVLRGWIDLFAAHTIEDPKARALSEKIVEKEQALATKRGAMKLGYVDPETGEFQAASSVKLALMMRTDKDAARRKAAYLGLRSIEPYVLEHGWLEIVRLRNQLGRMLGYEDYYDWRVSVVEKMSKRELFARLEDLAERTEARTREELAAFAKKHGPEALHPENFGFLRTGAITREIDPYFRFGASLATWGRAFTALGIRFRGATLTLDLVERPGKYENGFMHGPGPAFFDRGAWRPARINFTANAVPGAIGSGVDATRTFFHEGGHAAHFANILSDAPCFAQEFAPTSVAYAETQSMFCEALLGDADFRVRYTSDKDGRPMPMELIEAAIRETQPLRGWEVRAMLTVPFAERAVYEIPEQQLSPERVLLELRRIEQRMQGLSSGMRPILAVPHLLAGESSAYYHAYVLAEMAVEQTRAFFLQRDGHLTDNPRVGADLAEHYWAPGNRVPFDATVRALTGRSLAADALVEKCNRSVDETIARAREAVRGAEARLRPETSVALDATVHVIHGRERIASTEDGGFDQAAAAFERWVAAHGG